MLQRMVVIILFLLTAAVTMEPWPPSTSPFLLFRRFYDAFASIHAMNAYTDADYP